MLLKKITAAAVCVLGLTVLTGCNAAETPAKPDAKVSSAATSSKPVAIVNGVSIPQSQYNLLKQDRIQ